MLDVGGYRVAKSIVRLANGPPGTYKMVGRKGNGRPMIQAEAARIVAEAVSRIERVDAGG